MKMRPTGKSAPPPTPASGVVKPGVVDKPVNLHAFWDDVVLADDEARPKPVREAADRLAKAFPRDAVAAEVAVLDPLVWARDESMPRARADAYRDFGFGSSYWRNLSRSPSPLGLIPIHREWRAFVHKHEIPRKALHVSIGFVTLWLYHLGVQISAVHPILLTLLIPIATVDILRFRWSALNRTYIRYLGAFMRESEAHDRYNGVIMYLAGLWFTMRFCRKDVAVMSVLLLSWCDTAASTFGRLWGRYTPRIRKGKSLAGTIACFVVGVFAAVFFWGYVAPRTDGKYDRGANSFAFQGALTLPDLAREALGWSVEESTVTGPLAVAVMSLASGLIVSVSELMDVWELDDNLTIPVLSGLGLGAFLWAFGSG